jgi:hypothetical protein
MTREDSLGTAYPEDGNRQSSSIVRVHSTLGLIVDIALKSCTVHQISVVVPVKTTVTHRFKVMSWRFSSSKIDPLIFAVFVNVFMRRTDDLGEETKTSAKQTSCERRASLV